MVYLNNIVGYLNEVLAGRLTPYKNAVYNGITNTVSVRFQDGKMVSYPAVIDLDGKADAVPTLKRSDFNIWHRITANNIQYDDRNQYGDKSYSRSTTDLVMVVLGTRKKINQVVEQFSMILADTITVNVTAAEFSTLGLGELKVQASGINFDQNAVFNSEFKGVPSFVGSDMFMFSVRYRITGTYQNGCTNICDC